MTAARPRGSSRANAGGDSGLALISAIFVLAILSAVGIALLYTARAETNMARADLRSKKVFYLAEAGVEEARTRLRDANDASADRKILADELAGAAGGNGVLNFDVNTIHVVYNAGGVPTGLAGYGDDVPLVPLTAYGDGWYAAFLSNDPAEGEGTLTDSNRRLMITAVGLGAKRSFEVVQSVVMWPIMADLPATITLLGPDPNFDGGDSASKVYEGSDCLGAGGYTGEPGAYVPVVGVIDAAAEAAAEAGVHKPNTYTAGPYTGDDTVTNVGGTMDASWLSCPALRSLAEFVRSKADFICTTASPCSHWAGSTLATVTYVEGDVSLPTGQGLVLATGRISVGGSDNWDGVILAIGKGELVFSGGGSGHQIGATLAANIAGPDRTLFTADDCSEAPDGFGQAVYVASGGGNKDTIYCSDAIRQAILSLPLRPLGFLQR